MYNKLKQILYLIILILTPQINNLSSASAGDALIDSILATDGQAI
jgi:hypothetical protein